MRPGTEAAFLAPFPIRLLPGVGPRAEERLRRKVHVADLAPPRAGRLDAFIQGAG